VKEKVDEKDENKIAGKRLIPWNSGKKTKNKNKKTSKVRN
jgi:hypothetical protein